MNHVIKKNRKEIDALCKKHFVKRLYLFGSALTDAFNEKSDFDSFYEINEMKENPDFDYASNIFSFENELIELFGSRKIDLIRHDFNYPQLFVRAVAENKVLLYAE